MQKKFLTYLLTLLAAGLIFAPTALIAEEPNREQATEIENEIEDEDENEIEDEVEDEVENEIEDDDDNTASSEMRLRLINRRLERIQDRVGDEDLRDEIQERVQNQEEARERIQTALTRIEGRPAYLRFLIGPDYKNVGELRSQIVHLRNEIRQLEALKERLSGTEAEEVQTAIDELEAESATLEQDLQEKVSGFSLFGWLARLLSGNQE